MIADENSKRTRVEPIFGWLRRHGADDWPSRLLALAHGLEAEIQAGAFLSAHFEKERVIAPSHERLAWMLLNAHRLIPRDGRLWRELRKRTIEDARYPEIAGRLELGEKPPLPRTMVLEGSTHADCLVECETALIWIEGKRNDWLDPAIKWDTARDQLARNLEAARTLALREDKDYCLVICHEGVLKRHEEILIDGYRSRTWAGGWPHLDEAVQGELGMRIGTLTRSEIVTKWPAMSMEPHLASVAQAPRDGEDD